MSTYDFRTDTTEASSAEALPFVIKLALDELGLIENDDNLAEIHILASGQHGGFDIEIIHAVEDEDEDDA